MTAELLASYQLRPAPCVHAGRSYWTVHVDDKFSTQIGRHLEKGPDGWRMVFADDKVINMGNEREMRLIMRGLMIGRTIC